MIRLICSSGILPAICSQSSQGHRGENIRPLTPSVSLLMSCTDYAAGRKQGRWGSGGMGEKESANSAAHRVRCAHAGLLKVRRVSHQRGTCYSRLKTHENTPCTFSGREKKKGGRRSQGRRLRDAWRRFSANSSPAMLTAASAFCSLHLTQVGISAASTQEASAEWRASSWPDATGTWIKMFLLLYFFNSLSESTLNFLGFFYRLFPILLMQRRRWSFTPA